MDSKSGGAANTREGRENTIQKEFINLGTKWKNLRDL